MAKFCLAVDRPVQEDRLAKADFINIVAWRGAADQAKEGLKKGVLCLVEGRVITRTYDTDSGQRKWVTEVDAIVIRALVAGPVQGVDGYAQESYIPEAFPGEQGVQQTYVPGQVQLEEKSEVQIQESDFDFGDGTSADTGFDNGQGDLQFAPQFGDEVVEEDVPF
jgi:single-stranded DNA-binding protein